MAGRSRMAATTFNRLEAASHERLLLVRKQSHGARPTLQTRGEKRVDLDQWKSCSS